MGQQTKEPHVARAGLLRIVPAFLAAALFLAAAPSASALTVNASPGTVAPGGSMTAAWNGLPSEVSPADWIALYQAGSPDGSFLLWEYASGAATGSVTFIAPATIGTYEFRYFRNGGWTKVATSNTIRISGTAGAGPSLTFTATPAGITSGSSSTLAWSSPTATACIASGGWAGQRPASGTAIVTPASLTTYTLTCANASGNTSQSVIVTITGAVGFSLTAAPVTLTAGGAVTVSWTAPGGQTSAADWIALYRSTDPDGGSFLGWQYTGGAPSGTLAFTAPSGAGTYEFRYFLNGGWTRAATSNLASIADVLAPTVSVNAPAAGATVSGTVTIDVTASDDVGVTQVQLLLDGSPLGTPLTSSPYTLAWDSTQAADGAHTLSATARDADGNSTTAAAVSVTVANGGGPIIISAVSATAITISSATITWTTNQPADSLVEYGTTVIYGNAAGDGMLTTNHAVTIPGLLASTLYHYRVRSSAGSSSATSADATFTTGATGTGPYTLTASPAIVAPGSSVTATWSVPDDADASSDMVGLYAIGAPDNSPINAHFTNGVLSGTALLATPPTYGNYELRFMRLDMALGLYAARATSNLFTVGDTTPPAVAITAPVPGQVVPATTVFQATASDNVGVAGVRFQLDGSNIGAEDTTAPYSLSWDMTSTPPGVHNIRAVARDTTGNLTTSLAIFFVVPDYAAPTVSITAPANGSSVSLTITISATASDNVGVNRVEFRIDGALRNTDSSIPYTYVWDTTTAADGSHTIQVTAYDVAGNSSSSSVTVTVANDQVPPTVSMTSPASGTVSGMVTVTAGASDNIGVTQVQLLLDGAPLGGAITSAPYTTTWDSNQVSDGTHTFGATARDAAGNTASAAPVSVTVGNTIPAGLTASPATAVQGDTLTLGWVIPASQVSLWDWVGLYQIGSPDVSFVDWRWATGATIGSTTFTAPGPGTYEFRYFYYAGYTLLATSNTVTIGGGGGGGGGGNVTLTASPATASPGSNITVSWTGPAGHAAGMDWIGMFSSSASDTSYATYQYAGGSDSGSLTFTAFAQAGTYNFRYFRNGTWTKAGTSNDVTVGGGGGGGTPVITTLSASPASVAPGGTLTISWTASSGSPMPTDWIALYQAGDPDSTLMTYSYTGSSGMSGSITMTAPSAPGNYEVRYFLDNTWTRLAVSNTFVVAAGGGGGGGGGGAGTYTLTAGPGTVAPGDPVTVNWTATGTAAAADWVALYEVGAIDPSFLDWQYTGGGSSGTLTFPAQSTPGTYEFRLYLNSGWSKAATSNSFQVQ